MYVSLLAGFLLDTNQEISGLIPSSTSSHVKKSLNPDGYTTLVSECALDSFLMSSSARLVHLKSSLIHCEWMSFVATAASCSDSICCRTDGADSNTMKKD